MSGSRVTMRAMTPRDLKGTVALMDEVFRQGQGNSMGDDYAYVYARENLRNCRVAVAGGRVVAHCAARPSRVLVEGAEVGWGAFGNVCTHPDWRGRGLGGKLMAGLWNDLRRAGTDGLYISGGRGLYTRAGAVACGTERRLEIPVSATPAGRADDSLTLRAVSPADASTLARLHAGEPVAYRRDPAAFLAVLATGRVHDVAAEAWIIEVAGLPVAWAVIGPVWGKAPALAPRVPAVVLDWAGSRVALVLGLRLLLGREGWASLHLGVPVWDRDLALVLAERSVLGEWAGVPGTQVLLDPRRFWSRLQPAFARRLGPVAAKLRLVPSGAGFEIVLGAERHRIPDLPTLTRLLLGDSPETWLSLLPPRGVLHEALREILPVPFPPVGLNYM